MAEDNNQNNQQNETPSFKNAKELTDFIMDMQGQIANMQETVDKLSPVEQNAEGGEGESGGGEGEGNEQEEMSEEEVNEIDQMLQSE